MAPSRHSRLGVSPLRSALIGLAAILIVPGFAAQGQGSGSNWRMPLGGPDRAEPAAGSTDGRDSRDRLEATARRLLVGARKDIAEDRGEIGERVLEQLVARYPDTPAASEARRELYLIWGRKLGSGANGTVQGWMAPTAPQGGPRAAEGAKVGVGAAGPAAPPAWRTSIKSHRRLQDDLRHGVGDRIFFGPGSDELGGRGRALVKSLAGWLRDRPEIDIAVEGHADDAAVGGDDEALAAQRAAAVREMLLAEGIDSDRISVLMLGARDRIAICEDGHCAAQNRRVVLNVALRGSRRGAVESAGGRSPAGEALPRR
jgi:outer membrane protein OmpA-like peptidoglycan-associated protein